MFISRVNDDLDTPGALAVMWEMLKDQYIEPADKLAGLLEFDRVFGLNLAAEKKIEVPKSVAVLVQKREIARESKLWNEADELRKQIAALGYTVDDAPEGARVRLIPVTSAKK